MNVKGDVHTVILSVILSELASNNDPIYYYRHPQNLAGSGQEQWKQQQTVNIDNLLHII